jgi:hypothetical protein
LRTGVDGIPQLPGALARDWANSPLELELER